MGRARTESTISARNLYEVSRERWPENAWRTVRIREARALLLLLLYYCMPSVLWRCWLGGRKGIRPVKTEWWGAVVVICLEWGADLHMAQLMLLPLTVSCFSEIQIGIAFLVPAHPGSPGKRAIKRVCVCVCVFYRTQSTVKIKASVNYN